METGYLTADHLGSPRVNTDNVGAVKARHDYYAFGEEIFSGISGRTSSQKYVGDNIRQKFTGYERDDESGLDYAQARYYSSQHGRFTSVDPLMASAAIRNPQTFNRYTYALNSPYKFTDPLGLVATTPSGQGANDPWIPEMNDQSKNLRWGKDKPFDPTKDRPTTPEPGTETPINQTPIGIDPKTGRPIYDPKNKDAYNCHSYTWCESKGDPKDRKNKGVIELGADKWDQDLTNNLL